MESGTLRQVGGTPQLFKCVLKYYKTVLQSSFYYGYVRLGHIKLYGQHTGWC